MKPDPAPPPRPEYQPRTTRRRSQSSIRGAAVVVILGIVVAACTGSTDAATTRATDNVRAHLESTGVKLESARCGAPTGATETRECDLETPSGSTIRVRVELDSSGDYQYETLAGLVDGNSTAERLTAQIEARTNTVVTVKCPKVIAANTSDTFRCTATTKDDDNMTRRIEVTLLDDETGDFTYRVIQ